MEGLSTSSLFKLFQKLGPVKGDCFEGKDGASSGEVEMVWLSGWIGMYGIVALK